MSESPPLAEPARVHESGARAPARPGLATRWLRGQVVPALATRFTDRILLVLPDGARADAGPDARPIAATVHVRDDAFFRKLAFRGRLGLGESYVDGDWDADDLVRVLEAGARGEAAARPGLLGRLRERLDPRRPENDRDGARRYIHAHYDLGNEFFALWLEVSQLGFNDRFRRTWEYYLAVCEAAFLARRVSNLQLVLARPGEGTPEGASR